MCTLDVRPSCSHLRLVGPSECFYPLPSLSPHPPLSTFLPPPSSSLLSYFSFLPSPLPSLPLPPPPSSPTSPFSLHPFPLSPSLLLLPLLLLLSPFTPSLSPPLSSSSCPPPLSLLPQSSLTPLCNSYRELEGVGTAFIDSVCRLIALLLDYRNVSIDDCHKGRRMGCMLNLLVGKS